MVCDTIKTIHPQTFGVHGVGNDKFKNRKNELDFEKTLPYDEIKWYNTSIVAACDNPEAQAVYSTIRTLQTEIEELDNLPEGTYYVYVDVDVDDKVTTDYLKIEDLTIIDDRKLDALMISDLHPDQNLILTFKK